MWTSGVEENNNGDFSRFYLLVLNLRACLKRSPKGSLAELGVYKGNSAKLIHSLAPDRRLFLFDTFSGFADQDVSKESNAAPIGAFTDTSLSSVKSFVGESRNIIYCPGFFPDTTTAVPDGEFFSFVHLDCDLYAPTLKALDFFYRRMAEGGMIVIHDYSNPFWPGVARAVDEFFADKIEYPVLMPDKSGSAIVTCNSHSRYSAQFS